METGRGAALPRGGLDETLPVELEQAGQMVDQFIRHLMDKDLPPLAIASALLGGSMGLISRELGPKTLLGILDQAREAVRSGQFADLAEGDAPHQA